MNIDDLTLGDVEKLQKNLNDDFNPKKNDLGLNEQMGEYVIARTYSAGVWFGKIKNKIKDEVILTEARRLYCWKTKSGISLSEVALYGLAENDCKICESVDKVWLNQIELISMTSEAIKSIKEYSVYVA